MHDLSPQTVFLFLFLAFGMLCNFLLRARHVVSGKRNCGIFAFSVRIYVNLTGRLAVFNVCCSHRHKKLHILLVSLSFSPVLTLGFPKYSSSESLYLRLFNRDRLFFWSDAGVVVRCQGEGSVHSTIW